MWEIIQQIDSDASALEKDRPRMTNQLRIVSGLAMIRNHDQVKLEDFEDAKIILDNGNDKCKPNPQ